LTDQGIALSTAFRDLMVEITKELEAGISEADKTVLIRVLNQLKANAGWTDEQL
jgi:hypothetical protein